jgi:hypothetical protein
MKNILFAVLIISLNISAETTDETISKDCLRQALILEKDLKSRVFMDMTSAQSDELVRLSTGHCKRQFMQYDVKNIDIESNQVNRENEPGDWLTDYILNGESPEKAGNERLKRMQHK